MSTRLESRIAAALANYAADLIPEEWIQIDPATRHIIINLHGDLRDYIPEIDLDLLASHLADVIRKETIS